MLRTFTIRSELPVSAEHFWSTQSLAAVNEELHPQYRMTAPPEVLRAPISEWANQSNVLKSWILLRGCIPVDRHKFGTIEFTAPTAFVEISSSWLNSLWKHERKVGKSPGGCEVTDTISFESRLGLLSPWQKALYILAFRHRHTTLRSRYVRAAGG
jgi:ligand-binding SRPBCC domain-containing protein